MKIVRVYGDDWEGIYINGVLVTEGHRVTIEEVIDEISLRLPRMDITFDAIEADQKWLESRGGLTEQLEKVKKFVAR